MASKIASFVGTVQLRLKIEQATSTEDEPTPIYLLDDVVQAIGSTSKNVIDAVDIIQSRLQHRSPTVKQKTLKLIKHAAQRGSPELRRSLARNSASVRSLTTFRCAPDPFKGDIPWKRVQEYAKEALDALHAAPAAQQPTSSGPQLGGRIQGFGSTEPSSGALGSSTHTSSAMIGFGSDSVGFNHYSSSEAASQPYRAPLSGSTGAVLDTLSTGVRDLTDKAVGALTRPQHHRLNSMDSEDDSYGAAAGFYSSSGGSRPPVVMDRALASPSGATSTAQQTLEQRLVDKICTPTGVRASPSAEDLNTFLKAAASLDGIALAVAFQRKLETGSWQETLRALCAIEAFLEKDHSAASGELAVHFQSDVSVLRRAHRSTQTTVRQRAERVLKLLGADTLPSPAPGSDLLGGDLILETGGGGGSEAPVKIENAVDLLAGLDVVPPPTRSVSIGDDVFGDWSSAAAAAPSPVMSLTKQAPPASPMIQQEIDLLGGLSDLSLGSTTTATHTVQQQHQPLDDFFSMAPSSTAAAAVPQPQPLIGSSGGLDDFFSTSSFSPSNGNTGISPVGGLHTRTASLGLGNKNDDVLGAINAATSGISSSKREDVAFDFVQGAMAQLKTKK